MVATVVLSTAILVAQIRKLDYPPPGDYPHSFGISQKYDKFRNATNLELDLERVWRDPQNELKLSVFQFFEGDDLAKPVDFPLFRFVNRGSNGWRYLDDHSVFFLVDGERFRFEPSHQGDVGPGASVTEWFLVSPSKEQFLKIIYAKTVQVKVGSDEFELSGAYLTALKDLASYLGTPGRPLSSPEMKRLLRKTRALEDQGRDDDAREAYKRIAALANGTYEVAEASKGIKRLDDPVRKQAYKKSETERAKADREKALRSRIERNFRLGGATEKTNLMGALSYYKEVLKLANGLKPEPPEVEEARSRIKALDSGK